MTLENDASAHNAAEGEANDKWLFALDGSAKLGQSFHEQMTGTGDFGVFASTMRFRKPPGSDS